MTPYCPAINTWLDLAMDFPVVVNVSLTATLVPLSFMVPTVFMGDHAASAVPMTVVVLFARVVRFNPVGALIGRLRPVPLVPTVVAFLGILIASDPHVVVLGKVIAFDPDVVGAGARRHVRGTRRWRLSDANPERKLGMCARDLAQDHYKDDQRLQEIFPHA
jgi:hypothetical protein